MNDQLKEIFERYKKVPDFYGAAEINVNSRTPYNDQIIHIVSCNGDVDSLALLLENGANINSQGESGFTPLHYSVEQEKHDLLAYLVKNGADTSLRNDDGQTAEELAELLNNEMALRILREKH